MKTDTYDHFQIRTVNGGYSVTASRSDENNVWVDSKEFVCISEGEVAEIIKTYLVKGARYNDSYSMRWGNMGKVAAIPEQPVVKVSKKRGRPRKELSF